MRQTDPRVSYRLYHPLPILTQHPSASRKKGGRSSQYWKDFAKRRYEKKLNDCQNMIKKDQQRKQQMQQLMMRRKQLTGGMVGPEWTWGGSWSDFYDRTYGYGKYAKKKGGSWQSKWYLTPGQNRKRRNKLRAKCMRDISGGDLGKKYLNNCKSIMETSNYLRAVRAGTDAVKAAHS